MADVTHVEEHEDGTATLHFDLTDEEVRMLIQWGIKEAIKLAYQKAQNFDWKDSGSETNT